MGRKVNFKNAERIVESIQNHNNQFRPADIARDTGLHPQAVSRLLPVIEDVTGTLLHEDRQGRLGIFKRKK